MNTRLDLRLWEQIHWNSMEKLEQFNIIRLTLVSVTHQCRSTKQPGPVITSTYFCVSYCSIFYLFIFFLGVSSFFPLYLIFIIIYFNFIKVTRQKFKPPYILVEWSRKLSPVRLLEILGWDHRHLEFHFNIVSFIIIFFYKFHSIVVDALFKNLVSNNNDNCVFQICSHNSHLTSK
jgi:hypothetical protein